MQTTIEAIELICAFRGEEKVRFANSARRPTLAATLRVDENGGVKLLSVDSESGVDVIYEAVGTLEGEEFKLVAGRGQRGPGAEPNWRKFEWQSEFDSLIKIYRGAQEKHAQMAKEEAVLLALNLVRPGALIRDGLDVYIMRADGSKQLLVDEVPSHDVMWQMARDRLRIVMEITSPT